MANRGIQQKILKMKRRGRFARFSGATTRLVKTRVIQHLVYDSETSSHIEEKIVPVGDVSLSKQVINTGGGPDPERMQEYYQRVSKESWESYIPDAVPLTEPIREMCKTYDRLVKETPKKNRVTLIQESVYRLDLFIHGDKHTFVEVDYTIERFSRSRPYDSLKSAFNALKRKRITWVDEAQGEV